MHVCVFYCESLIYEWALSNLVQEPSLAMAEELEVEELKVHSNPNHTVIP